MIVKMMPPAKREKPVAVGTSIVLESGCRKMIPKTPESEERRNNTPPKSGSPEPAPGLDMARIIPAEHMSRMAICLPVGIGDLRKMGERITHHKEPAETSSAPSAPDETDMAQ